MLMGGDSRTSLISLVSSASRLAHTNPARTQILLTALKTSNVATGEKLAEAIRATKYAGLLGNFAFDDTGVGIFATAIGLIQGGKLLSAG